MARSVLSLDNEIKYRLYETIKEALGAENYEVLEVPLSEDSKSKGYRISIPVVDAERNEKAAIIEISIPRGKRDGTQYDPYEEHQRYLDNLAEQTEKERARKEKAEREEAEKKRRREARKTIKSMKQDVKEIFTSEEKGE